MPVGPPRFARLRLPRRRKGLHSAEDRRARPPTARWLPVLGTWAWPRVGAPPESRRSTIRRVRPRVRRSAAAHRPDRAPRVWGRPAGCAPCRCVRGPWAGLAGTTKVWRPVPKGGRLPPRCARHAPRWNRARCPARRPRKGRSFLPWPDLGSRNRASPRRGCRARRRRPLQSLCESLRGLKTPIRRNLQGERSGRRRRSRSPGRPRTHGRRHARRPLCASTRARRRHRSVRSPPRVRRRPGNRLAWLNRLCSRARSGNVYPPPGRRLRRWRSRYDPVGARARRPGGPRGRTSPRSISRSWVHPARTPGRYGWPRSNPARQWFGSR